MTVSITPNAGRVILPAVINEITTSTGSGLTWFQVLTWPGSWD